MKRITILQVIAAVFVISARGQNFTNLDFESAYDLPGNPGNGELVPAANALPDWTAYYGPPSNGDPYSSITYASNNISGAVTEVALAGGSLALSGEFSVWLESYGSISQTGLVPDNAGSVQFEAWETAEPDDFSVTLGGQNLSYLEISTGPDYYVFAANIPADLDGYMEALTFDYDGPGGTILDNIEFMPVPEPSEYTLMGMGVIVIGFCDRRRRSFPAPLQGA